MPSLNSFATHAPDDYKKYTPPKYSEVELNAFNIELKHRDGCQDYLVEHKKWASAVLTKYGTIIGKGKLDDHWMFYFDHWIACREDRAVLNGSVTHTPYL